MALARYPNARGAHWRCQQAGGRSRPGGAPPASPPAATATSRSPAPCPFCFPAEERIAFEDRLTRALWDAFPVSEGHLLIVTRRRVPTWFDASEEE